MDLLERAAKIDGMTYLKSALPTLYRRQSNPQRALLSLSLKAQRYSRLFNPSTLSGPHIFQSTNSMDPLGKPLTGQEDEDGAGIGVSGGVSLFDPWWGKDPAL